MRAKAPPRSHRTRWPPLRTAGEDKQWIRLFAPADRGHARNVQADLPA